MIEFKRHRPAYMDGPSLEVERYETFDQLINSDYFKKWSNDKNFSYFAKNENLILCILNEGFTWWVIGRILNEVDIPFPKWEGGKYKAILQNGTEVVLTKDEVNSSSGDDLWLKDGTKAKRIRI